MANKVHTVGVLTSGGDAPGMNAAIRAVVRTAIAKGLNVKGILRGYAGLLNEEIKDMDYRSVADIIQRGGTVLYTARCEEFKEESIQEQAAGILRKHGIDSLVVIGGDGSYRGAGALARQGINTVGLPGTSHERCSIIEVMGRRAGYIALWCGLANGAEDVLLPERYDNNEQAIINRIIEHRNKGKAHHIIVNAEGIGHSASMAKRIEAATGIETRATILGYMQRGGTPTCKDRVYASIMGAKAIELLLDGKKNRAVGYLNGQFQDFDIEEVLNASKDIHEDQYQIFLTLSGYR